MPIRKNFGRSCRDWLTGITPLGPSICRQRSPIRNGNSALQVNRYSSSVTRLHIYFGKVGAQALSCCPSSHGGSSTRYWERRNRHKPPLARKESGSPTMISCPYPPRSEEMATRAFSNPSSIFWMIATKAAVHVLSRHWASAMAQPSGNERPGHDGSNQKHPYRFFTAGRCHSDPSRTGMYRSSARWPGQGSWLASACQRGNTDHSEGEDDFRARKWRSCMRARRYAAPVRE